MVGVIVLVSGSGLRSMGSLNLIMIPVRGLVSGERRCALNSQNSIPGFFKEANYPPYCCLRRRRQEGGKKKREEIAMEEIYDRRRMDICRKRITPNFSSFFKLLFELLFHLGYRSVVPFPTITQAVTGRPCNLNLMHIRRFEATPFLPVTDR